MRVWLSPLELLEFMELVEFIPKYSSTRHPHSCDQCDFNTESEKGLKIHMGRKHEVKCSGGSEKFAGDSKLKTHMCRQHISNPSSDQLYMKNWFVKDE